MDEVSTMTACDVPSCSGSIRRAPQIQPPAVIHSRQDAQSDVYFFFFCYSALFYQAGFWFRFIYCAATATLISGWNIKVLESIKLSNLGTFFFFLSGKLALWRFLHYFFHLLHDSESGKKLVSNFYWTGINSSVRRPIKKKLYLYFRLLRSTRDSFRVKMLNIPGKTDFLKKYVKHLPMSCGYIL